MLFQSKLPPIGSQTLIYAHRGAMGYRPQNTLEAFALAWQMGAAGIELDVQCARDGVPVVFHDDTLDALTNGTGRIRDHAWANLARLDAGSHFSPQYQDARIPTLEAVLRARPVGTFVNIELKTELAFAEQIPQTRPILVPEPNCAMSIEAVRIAQQTAACIQALAGAIPDLEAHLIVTSFHPAAIKAFHALMPTVAIGHLFSQTSLVDTTLMMAQTPCLALHLDYKDVNHTLIEQAHRAGKYVNCWTVNDVNDAQRLIDWGVDGILTNYPDRILQQLNKSRNHLD